MPREFSRHERVARQIQRELAEVIQREVKDPQVGFATVNDVEVTRDLAVARVYVSVLSPSDADAKRLSIEALNRASNFIHGQVSKRMRMRHVPELRFILDESIERGLHMDALLKATRSTDKPEE